MDYKISGRKGGGIMKISKQEIAVYIIVAVILIWFIASFIDTNIHNHSDYIYSSWNIFSILVNKYIYGR